MNKKNIIHTNKSCRCGADLERRGGALYILNACTREVGWMGYGDALSQQVMLLHSFPRSCKGAFSGLDHELVLDLDLSVILAYLAWWVCAVRWDRMLVLLEESWIHSGYVEIWYGISLIFRDSFVLLWFHVAGRWMRHQGDLASVHAFSAFVLQWKS